MFPEEKQPELQASRQAMRKNLTILLYKLDNALHLCGNCAL
jgi:hypothetical protein